MKGREIIKEDVRRGTRLFKTGKAGNRERVVKDGDAAVGVKCRDWKHAEVILMTREEQSFIV